MGESLWALVATLGTPLVRAETITGIPANGARETFRLRFEDGGSLKGRRFRTAAHAEVVWRVLASRTAPFLGRAVAHRDEAMLEEWVEGDILVQGRVDQRLVRAAGQMLGTLHGLPPPSSDGIDFQPLDSHAWVRKTAENLRTLRDRGLATTTQVDLLQTLLLSRLPAAAPIGIVHRDMCPQNLIADASERLMSVDNGSLTVGAIDEDLCRVWYRWPMTTDERVAFLDGYRECRDADPLYRPSLFWTIVVVANSARARLGLSAAAAATTFRRLDRFVSGQQSDWWTGRGFPESP